MKIVNNAMLLNLLNPNPISITNPNGAKVTTHPKVEIPVGENKLLIIPELANQKAVNPETQSAINIIEKTLETKFLAMGLEIYLDDFIDGFSIVY